MHSYKSIEYSYIVYDVYIVDYIQYSICIDV